MLETEHGRESRDTVGGLPVYGGVGGGGGGRVGGGIGEGRNREESGVSTIDVMLAEKRKEERDSSEKKLPPEVAIMTPILRFLQLLCENHNRYFYSATLQTNRPIGTVGQTTDA